MPKRTMTGAEYVASYIDLAAAKVDGFQHYVDYGLNEGRNTKIEADIEPVVPPVDPPVTPPVVPSVDGSYTISNMVGTDLLTIRAVDQYAGAISSLEFRNQQYVRITCTGDGCQSAIALKQLGERYNPTEAGSRKDGTGPSSSRLLAVKVEGNVLKTMSKMAFYLQPGEISAPCGVGEIGLPAVNTTILSDYVLNKQVTIGLPCSDHVIQYLVNVYVPEVQEDAVFEIVTGYMPAEFSNFYTFNPATGAIAALSAGPGEQGLPLIFSTVDGTHAMGVYSPNFPETAFPQHGYGRWTPPWVAAGEVKWNMVGRKVGPVPIGNYGFECYLIVGSLEEVRVSMIQLINYLSGTTPPVTPDPDPIIDPVTPGQPITGFREVTEWRNNEVYFSLERPNGILAAGCWNHSSEQSVDLMKLLSGKKELWQRFPAETSFVDLCEHNGRWYGISEQYQGRAAIIRLESSGWGVVYKHERCELALGMVSNKSDGYLYVSMMVLNGNWDLGEAPSGLIRSKTGDPGTWEWLPERHNAGYAVAGLCLHTGPRGVRVHGAGGNDLLSSAALVSECHPENSGDGDGMSQARHLFILEDQDPATGRSCLWSAHSFKGNLLVGGTTSFRFDVRARICRVRFDVPKYGYPASLETLYTLPQGYNAVYWIGSDPKGENCYALATREDGNGNGMVLHYAEGVPWHKIWDAPCPVLWDAFFDTDGKMKIAGGRSGSVGMILESY